MSRPGARRDDQEEDDVDTCKGSGLSSYKYACMPRTAPFDTIHIASVGAPKEADARPPVNFKGLD